MWNHYLHEEELDGRGQDAKPGKTLPYPPAHHSHTHGAAALPAQNQKKVWEGLKLKHSFPFSFVCRSTGLSRTAMPNTVDPSTWEAPGLEKTTYSPFRQPNLKAGVPPTAVSVEHSCLSPHHRRH